MPKTYSITGQNLEKLWKSLLGLIIVILTSPIILPIFIVFYAIGESVKRYYGEKRGPSVSKVRGMDGAFGHEVMESRPFICAYYNLHGKADIKKMRERFQEMVLDAKDDKGRERYHKLKQSIGLRYAYFLWRDTDDFRIEDHIRLVDIHTVPLEGEEDQINRRNPKGKTEEETKENYRNLFCKYLTTYANEKLSRNKPQWEILLFPRDDDRHTIILRVHHAIADGVSLVRMFVESLVEPRIDPPSVGPKPPNIFISFLWHLWACCLFPFGVWYMLFHNDKNALHGPKLSGQKIYAVSNEISLAEVKEIKTKYKATVNDVLMSCLSAALTKYYKKKNTPTDFTTIMIPVSLHDLKKPNIFMNKFSWAICLLPCRDVSTIERLYTVRATLNAMKFDPLITTFYYVVRIVNGIFPAKIANYLFVANGITMACSNVPGPQQEVSVCGNPVEEMAFMVPDRSPTGCGMAILSYNGAIRATFMVDRALLGHVSEADDILGYFEDELYNIRKELKLS